MKYEIPFHKWRGGISLSRAFRLRYSFVRIRSDCEKISQLIAHQILQSSP